MPGMCNSFEGRCVLDVGIIIVRVFSTKPAADVVALMLLLVMLVLAESFEV